MNKGFTLIEVILSITIIGIITSIMIPTYKNYDQTKEELVVKEKALVIQNEIMTFLNGQLSNTTQTYPVIGSSSTTYLGVNNVSTTSLKSLVRGCMSYSKILDINTFITVVEEEFSGFTKGIGYINIKITYKSGEYVVVKFKIIDNQINYKDVALIHSVTYYNKEGLHYEVFM